MTARINAALVSLFEVVRFRCVLGATGLIEEPNYQKSQGFSNTMEALFRPQTHITQPL